MSGPTGQASPDTLLSYGVFAQMGCLVAIAVVLAAMAAPLVRRYYGRRVRRLMGLDQLAPQAVGTAFDDEAQSSGALKNIPLLQGGADGLAAAARQAQQRIFRATLLAWLTFVVISLLIAGIDPKAELEDRLVFCTLAAIFGVVPVVINLPRGWTHWSLADVVSAKAALGRVTLGQLCGQFLWQRIPQSVANPGVLVARWYRRLRGQVLPVFVVFGCWLGLFVGIYAYWEPRGGDVVMARFTQAKEGSATYASAQLIISLVLVLFLWLGFRLLGGFAGVMRRGWASESSLGSGFSLTLVAALLAGEIAESPEIQFGFWAKGAILLWVAATVGVYVLAVGRRRSEAGPQLLVLRVFSEDPRRQKLLDELQDHWRYLGPVQGIAGFDMVDVNVDLYEASMFLSNRIHELFLPVGPSPAQLKAHLRTAPDYEGRYPINEVFCFNTAWRDTVKQMMRLSDAIVLDVRGLTAQREGTCYEIGLLACHGELSKVVAIVDDSTDWAHVESLVRAHGANPEGLTRLSIGARPQSQELFRKLLQAAAQPAPAQQPVEALVTFS
jgi:hypothetical protein